MSGIMHLAARGVIAISGPDAGSFLQGLVTNDVRALSHRGCQFAALLSPQGKILFDFLLFRTEPETFLADCEKARMGDLARRLQIYRLRANVRIEETALQLLWNAPDGVTDPRHPGLGTRRIVSRADAPEGGAEHAALRHALGVPEGSDDFGIETILALEGGIDRLNGVSFTKGCYVGQENTARMHYRHKAGRLLLPVTVDGALGEDNTLRTGETRVGTLMPSRRFALLRAEAVEDSPFTCGGASVTVHRPLWLKDDFDA